MNFYVVGFGEPMTRSTRYPHSGPVLGDALVHASSSRDALSRVRQLGLIPNPGDVYILGGKGWEEYKSETPVEEWMKDEAQRNPSGVSILWTSRE